MPHFEKTIVLCSSLLVLAAMAGCNRGSDEKTAPAAAINGSSGATPVVGGNPVTTPAKPAADPKHPLVLIETTLGNITVQLDAEQAPETVNNFLSYVKSGHYEQTIVHQVYPGQGLLAGGYDTKYVEKKPRTAIRNEADNGLKNRRGTIGMVRLPDTIDSATCQFFVNVADNPTLDHRNRHSAAGYGYCVFGEVTDGIDVVDKIGSAKVHDTKDFERTPEQQIVVKSIHQIR